MSGKIPECPICYQRYSSVTNAIQTPKLLSCGHTLCAECCNNLVVTRKDKSAKIVQCPHCRQDTKVDSRKGFANNFTLIEFLSTHSEAVDGLLPKIELKESLTGKRAEIKVETHCADCEVARAESHCINCEASFCAECWKSNHRSKILAKHQKIPVHEAKQIAKELDAPKCPEHAGFHLNMYCTKCRCFVCSTCVGMGKHFGHQSESVENRGERYRSLLIQKTLQLESLGRSVKQSSERIDLGLQELQASTDLSVDLLQKGFKQLHEALEQREKMLTNRIMTLSAENRDSLCQQRIDAAHISSDITNVLERAKNLKDLDVFDVVANVESVLDVVDSTLSRSTSQLEKLKPQEKSSVPSNFDFMIVRDVLEHRLQTDSFIRNPVAIHDPLAALHDFEIKAEEHSSSEDSDGTNPGVNDYPEEEDEEGSEDHYLQAVSSLGNSSRLQRLIAQEAPLEPSRRVQSDSLFDVVESRPQRTALPALPSGAGIHASVPVASASSSFFDSLLSRPSPSPFLHQRQVPVNSHALSRDSRSSSNPAPIAPHSRVAHIRSRLADESSNASENQYLFEVSHFPPPPQLSESPRSYALPAPSPMPAAPPQSSQANSRNARGSAQESDAARSLRQRNYDAAHYY
jgi:hypothetical protein